MYIGLMRDQKASKAYEEIEARLRQRDALCKDLHYTLTQAAWFLLGMNPRHPGGANTQAAFYQFDHAIKLREEIEALDQGAPSS